MEEFVLEFHPVQTQCMQEAFEHIHGEQHRERGHRPDCEACERHRRIRTFQTVLHNHLVLHTNTDIKQINKKNKIP
jgi:hypothetical protein